MFCIHRFPHVHIAVFTQAARLELEVESLKTQLAQCKVRLQRLDLRLQRLGAQGAVGPRPIA